MQILQLLFAVVVLLSATEQAASDVILFTNKLRPGTEDAPLRVQCRGPAAQAWGQTFTLAYNATIRIAVPEHQDIGSPGICSANFHWEAEYFTFIVYSYPRDHQRCKNSCKLEARWDGLYGFNCATEGWDLIAYYPIHLLSEHEINH